MRVAGLRGLLIETFGGWWEDKAPRLGASLAYYTILALAPLVILVTPVAELLFGREGHDEVVAHLAELVGRQGAAAVRTVLGDAHLRGAASPAARTVGVLVLVFGASSVFAELQDAMDTIWEVTPRTGHNVFFALLRKRFLSFAMVLGTGFLLIVSLLFSAVLSHVRTYAEQEVQAVAWVWTVLHAVVSFGVVTLLFAMIYKVLPDVTMPWRGVWIGATLTSGLFSLGRFGIGTYLGRASLGSMYGAAGSAIVLLVWIYYSAQILYLGVEFTKAYTRRAGERVVPLPEAVPLTEAARVRQGIPHAATVERAEQKADAPPLEPPAVHP